MRRMHTKEEIFEFIKQSPTAAQLAADLATIVAFDRNEATENGRVPTQMIGGDWGVKKEDIPEQDGVYRTAYGIFVKTHTGQYSYKVLALYNNNFYIQDRDNTTETDFLFVAANLLVKPVYIHPISIYSTSTGLAIGCLVFDNSPTPYTRETFKQLIDRLYTEVGDTVRIVATGSFISAGNQIIASWIFKTTATYGIAGRKASDGTDGNLTQESYYDLFPAGLTFVDGVNKIN